MRKKRSSVWRAVTRGEPERHMQSSADDDPHASRLERGSEGKELEVKTYLKAMMEPVSTHKFNQTVANFKSSVNSLKVVKADTNSLRAEMASLRDELKAVKRQNQCCGYPCCVQ